MPKTQSVTAGGAVAGGLDGGGPMGSTQGLSGVIERVRFFLPRGHSLPEKTWISRHRLVIALLWAHAIGLGLFAFLAGNSWLHSIFEGGVVAATALVAAANRLGRRTRTAVASIGLITSSAILVHLSGGYIEMHFHFFVMVAVVALYQDWIPFLVAIGYVALHHGVVGVLAPQAVYNHPEALAHPWRWAAIHAAFVLAESAACLVTWRQDEVSRGETDRKNEEVTLTLSQLGDAQHLAGIGSWQWDVKAELLTWSEELFRIYGKDFATYRPNYVDFLTMVHPEDQSRLLEAIQRTGETMQPFEFEHRIVRDGEVRFLRSRGEPVPGEDGGIARLIGTAQDITEQRKADEAKARLAEIVISSADAIVGVSREGMVESWNLGAERLYGYSAEEITGKPIFVLAPEELADEEVKLIERVMTGERIKNHDTHRIAKDGTSIYVSLSISPIRDHFGNIVGASKIARDISQQRRAEQALRSALETQQEMVNKLKELDSIKSSFVSSVSHELRTPLTSIVGYVELMLEDEPVSPDHENMLRVVEKNSRRLMLLIEDLLTLSRIESGEFNVTKGSASLEDLLNQVRQTVFPSLDSAGQELVLSIPSELPRVGADARQLERVLFNLISNAVKFSSPGGRIDVSAAPQGDMVAVSVRDSGIGIPSEEQSQLFTRFFRASTAEEKAIQGTGLGLAICKEIVQQHGGSIWVDSIVGEGTTVTFTVPQAAVVPV